MEKGMKIREVAALCGVSVRTLRYYDRIGLLPPAAFTQAGYRLYGEESLMRLQEILFFRELEFSLEEIRAILDTPGYDRREALRRQRELLIKKRERLERLIELAQRSSEGLDTAQLDMFDCKELEQMREKYAREARERWGSTAAYRQAEMRDAGRTQEVRGELAGQMAALFKEFAALRGGDPAGAAAQEAVGRLQDFITAHYYDCTPELLPGLADMYEKDERFRKWIDQAGEGTAAFAAAAMRCTAGSKKGAAEGKDTGDPEACRPPDCAE